MVYSRIALVMAPLLVLGCGGEKVPATHAVKGVVMFEGKPLEGADVQLIPSNPTDPAVRSAGAVTDSEGNFAVKTFWNGETQLDGALPGDYGIAVTKMEKRDVPPEMKPEDVMAMHMKLGAPKPLLPQKYAAPTTSGFRVTVGNKSPEPLKLELN